MQKTSLLRWIAYGALAGFAVTATLLSVFSVAPASWHRHLEPAFLVLCPPSIILMATEACSGWLSWCSAQFVLLTALLNTLLYMVIAVVVWAALKAITRGGSGEAV